MQANEIAAVVRDSLELFRQRGDDRNHSLATKWLHFCFPETFAIYDSFASKSIGSVFSLLDITSSTERLDSSQFDSEKIGKTSGEGYIGVLNFYRSFWNTACTSGLDAQIRAVADENQSMLRGQPGGEQARVSTVDVLDKLLWKAGQPKSDPASALGVSR